ncbi:hypothetical protein CRI94_11180 [Longibacter salinarum]|uniref:Uncharacterized protein n=1 Tax=Longibacter salinarum TaxID=1850348 RepID=A0A2A8CX97_9BACT|nr:hypothetical protein CRI94_11180 [Longibacter salinarum]
MLLRCTGSKSVPDFGVEVSRFGGVEVWKYECMGGERVREGKRSAKFYFRTAKFLLEISRSSEP